jgi:hypothetical protein
MNQPATCDCSKYQYERDTANFWFCLVVALGSFVLAKLLLFPRRRRTAATSVHNLLGDPAIFTHPDIIAMSYPGKDDAAAYQEPRPVDEIDEDQSPSDPVILAQDNETMSPEQVVEDTLRWSQSTQRIQPKLSASRSDTTTAVGVLIWPPDRVLSKIRCNKSPRRRRSRSFKQSSQRPRTASVTTERAKPTVASTTAATRGNSEGTRSVETKGPEPPHLPQQADGERMKNDKDYGAQSQDPNSQQRSKDATGPQMTGTVKAESIQTRRRKLVEPGLEYEEEERTEEVHTTPREDDFPSSVADDTEDDEPPGAPYFAEPVKITYDADNVTLPEDDMPVVVVPKHPSSTVARPGPRTRLVVSQAKPASTEPDSSEMDLLAAEVCRQVTKRRLAKLFDEYEDLKCKVDDIDSNMEYPPDVKTYDDSYGKSEYLIDREDDDEPVVQFKVHRPKSNSQAKPRPPTPTFSNKPIRQSRSSRLNRILPAGMAHLPRFPRHRHSSLQQQGEHHTYQDADSNFPENIDKSNMGQRRGHKRLRRRLGPIRSINVSEVHFVRPESDVALGSTVN